MRKKSLIHLHQLFTELRHEYETRGIVDESTFTEYDSKPLNCTHIHNRKTTHKDAVFLLVDGLTDPEATNAKQPTDSAHPLLTHPE